MCCIVLHFFLLIDGQFGDFEGLLLCTYYSNSFSCVFLFPFIITQLFYWIYLKKLAPQISSFYSLILSIQHLCLAINYINIQWKFFKLPWLHFLYNSPPLQTLPNKLYLDLFSSSLQGYYTYFERKMSQEKVNLKFSKSANLIKILIKISMSILTVLPFKTRKITKKVINPSSKPCYIKKRSKFLKIEGESATKSMTSLQSITKEQTGAGFNANHELSEFDLSHFQSYNPYTLGSINSIAFSNGRIYDLLYIKKVGIQQQKTTKCRCMRSRCSAKYCDCYANGQICGIQCLCVQCENLTLRNSNVRKTSGRFCKCSKSGCQKKYCECLQRGDACSSKCKCCNCKNHSGDIGCQHI